MSVTNTYLLRQRTRREITLDALQGQIRELYEKDFTDEAIAERLRINGTPVDRSYVTKARNAMGLPPRWGRKNGYTFTRQNDLDLLDLKANTRLTWIQISILFNMPVGVLYARHQLLLTMASQHGETRQTKRKKCMTCPEYFLTDQPRQIHMCDACKKRIESTGSSYDDSGPTGGISLRVSYSDVLGRTGLRA